MRNPLIDCLMTTFRHYLGAAAAGIALITSTVTACGDGEGEAVTPSSSTDLPAMPSGYHALFPAITGMGGLTRSIPRGSSSIFVSASCVGTGQIKIAFEKDGGGLSFVCDPHGLPGSVTLDANPNATTMKLETSSDNTWRIQVSGSPRSS